MHSDALKKLLLRYVAEIVVIFLGITISFLFDQWREEQRHKEETQEFIQSLLTDLKAKQAEIISDNPSATAWVQRLDSIQRNRTSGTVPRSQLIWFFKIMLRGGTFFFNSTTPTFSGSEGLQTWQNLPDSLRRSIYHVYMEDFLWNHLAYQQLSETMNEFRNSVMTTSGILALNLDETSPDKDVELFAREIAKPEYGGIIQSIIQGERFLFKVGNSSIADLDRLIASLEQVTKVSGK